MKVKKIETLPGDNGNAFSSSKRLYHSINVNESLTIAEGEISCDKFVPINMERGGVVVFSTDVNAVKLSENKIINWIKQKSKTVENRLTCTGKIDRVAKSNYLVRWYIGKNLDWRYKSRNGKTYGENSLSVEIIGVDTDKLLSIAEELCNLFVQETVLVKDYNTGNIMFVNGDTEE